jgi:ABC-type transport system involved in multi-copper enzyme maturation permease subunit
MMNQVFKLNSIAYYTFREIFKSRIILNVVFLGIALGGISYIASEFTFGVPGRIALDFGLGTLHITSNIVALFLGVGLVSQEIESRTVYMILSRPVSRSTFILGRIAGMLWIQFLNFIILGGLSLSIYFFYGGSFSGIIFWAFLFTFIESLLVLLLAILFSLLVNKIIAVSNTIILLLCGHILNETKLISFLQSYPLFKFILNFFSFIFPNFYKLNLRDFVLYDQVIPNQYILMTFAYSITYSLFLVGLTCYIFSKKNLD